MKDNRATQSVRRWADIVIERWQQKIKQLDVIDTGELYKSFAAQVISDAAGDPVKVTFTFLYYGRFSDMGAGIGMEAGNRQRKPWYSSVFIREVNMLGMLMAKRYGYDAGEVLAFNGVINM